MPGVSVSAAVAGWLSVSALQLYEIVGCAESAFPVRWLWTPDLGDGGYDFSGYPNPFERVVPGDVVDHHTEERSQRLGVAACVGTEAIPDSLDMAAQIAKRDGQTGTRSAEWQGGSG